MKQQADIMQKEFEITNRPYVHLDTDKPSGFDLDKKAFYFYVKNIGKLSANYENGEGEIIFSNSINKRATIKIDPKLNLKSKLPIFPNQNNASVYIPLNDEIITYIKNSTDLKFFIKLQINYWSSNFETKEEAERVYFYEFTGSDIKKIDDQHYAAPMELNSGKAN